MDPIRARFLENRVLTATPVQRVVMLYDRLLLDLARAEAGSVTSGDSTVDSTVDTAAGIAGVDGHLDHATEIVAELLGSLDHDAGGPAGDLAALYGYVLRTLMTARLSGDPAGIATVRGIVGDLRQTWAQVAAAGETVAAGTSTWTA